MKYTTAILALSFTAFAYSMPTTPEQQLCRQGLENCPAHAGEINLHKRTDLKAIVTALAKKPGERERRITAAATYIHEEWKGRECNSWNTKLQVPYARLDPTEKDKDIAQVEFVIKEVGKTGKVPKPDTLASELHEIWRKNWDANFHKLTAQEQKDELNDNTKPSTGYPRWKPVDSLEGHEAKKDKKGKPILDKKKGKQQVNINVPFKKVHSTYKKENQDAGEAAVKAAKDYFFKPL